MRIVLFATALLLPLSAYAQEAAPGGSSGRPTAEGPDRWSVTVGVAPVLSPAWQGSSEMALSLYPDLRVNYGDLFFASVPDGIGLNVVNGGGWRAGPIAKLRFGRDEEEGGSPFLIAGASDALIGMGDVDAAVEVGGFVEKRFGSREQWRARGEVRRGFGGHEGVVADLSVTHQMRMGRAIVNFGPRATLASEEYIQTFFGIDAGQSSRTGLGRYDAEGGLLSFGVGGTLIRPLDRRSAITVFTSLERLGDEAGDSPLIRERGSRTQFTIGIGYGFRFNL